MKLFTEICRAKPAWLALSADERAAFLEPVGSVMRKLESQGANIVAWGFNDLHTPQRAPYDFFATIVFPDDETMLSYEQLFRRAGWYDYFEQVNIAGDIKTYSDVLDQLKVL